MTEHKCVVNSCCCGCSLRSGTLAIAIFNLILSLIQIVLGSIAIASGAIVVWPELVIGILRLIISSILINGVRKESRGQVLAWVWIVTILTVLATISVIVLFVLGSPISYVVDDIIGILLNIYFIIVVRSFAFKLGTPEAMA